MSFITCRLYTYRRRDRVALKGTNMGQNCMYAGKDRVEAEGVKMRKNFCVEEGISGTGECEDGANYSYYKVYMVNHEISCVCVKFGC